MCTYLAALSCDSYPNRGTVCIILTSSPVWYTSAGIPYSSNCSSSGGVDLALLY